MHRYPLLTATLLICMTGMSFVGAADVQRPRESIVLDADGEHCVVRKVRILCTQLATHLRDTLKLPNETIVLLRAGRTVPHEAVRNVLRIIDNSGFSHLVPLQPAPPTRKEK